MNFKDEADYQRWRALPQAERDAEEDAYDEPKRAMRAEHYQRLAERRARLEQTGCARISDFGQFDVPVTDPVALEATHEAAANPEMACSRCARRHISTVPCDVTLQGQNEQSETMRRNGWWRRYYEQLSEQESEARFAECCAEIEEKETL